MAQLFRHGFLRAEQSYCLKVRIQLCLRISDLSHACLNVVYKLWTSCLTQVLMHHCVVNEVLHPAQKGCAQGQLGCVDHLLLNSRLQHQVKSKNRSLAIAWLNYKKAYDSVPHNWIVQCLKLFHFILLLLNVLRSFFLCGVLLCFFNYLAIVRWS